MTNTYALLPEEIELIRNYRRMSSAHREMLLFTSRQTAAYPPLPQTAVEPPRVVLVSNR